jgi:hypothetical protein
MSNSIIELVIDQCNKKILLYFEYLENFYCSLYEISIPGIDLLFGLKIYLSIY